MSLVEIYNPRLLFGRHGFIWCAYIWFIYDCQRNKKSIYGITIVFKFGINRYFYEYLITFTIHRVKNNGHYIPLVSLFIYLIFCPVNKSVEKRLKV